MQVNNALTIVIADIGDLRVRGANREVPTVEVLPGQLYLLLVIVKINNRLLSMRDCVLLLERYLS